MANFSIGSSVPMSTLRDGFGYGGPNIDIETIKDTVYPYSVGFRSLSAFQNQGLWRYRIMPDDGSRGWVQMTYPVNSGQIFGSYLSPWFRSGDYPYTSIYAQGIYPYNFQYWFYEGGGVFSYGSAPNVNWNQSGVLNLRAYFA
jgi:hypothetical protein